MSSSSHQRPSRKPADSSVEIVFFGGGENTRAEEGGAACRRIDPVTKSLGPSSRNPSSGNPCTDEAARPRTPFARRPELGSFRSPHLFQMAGTESSDENPSRTKKENSVVVHAAGLECREMEPLQHRIVPAILDL
ncbi:hypothetical protein C8035_v011141 [Colletotrichum spinosum]|uniref:Uncharacterized protein n=1 Tax=Colletotrichum spinosum TaxID=1347390 RepID=A0A4R8PV00_9PEZI|nr:hypothetical protein C8035_v011141 [Colletotrichum spinosum]